MVESVNRIKGLVKSSFDLKIIRFFFVAGINTAFGYGIFVLFLLIGLHYVLAGFLATIIGILFNFKTYGVIVFKNKSNKLIFRFLFVYFVTYCVAIFFIWAFSLIHVNHYIASAIIAIPNALLGYFLNKKLVFENKIVQKL